MVRCAGAEHVVGVVNEVVGDGGGDDDDDDVDAVVCFDLEVSCRGVFWLK